jgi:hypothetical protein
MERLVGLLDELRDDTKSLASSVTEVGLHTAPRRRRQWTTTNGRTLLRIAAGIVIVFGAGLGYRAGRNPAAVDRHTGIPVSVTAGITLREESHDRFIAVAAPSDEPNVQTFWLYPSVAVTESRDRS